MAIEREKRIRAATDMDWMRGSCSRWTDLVALADDDEIVEHQRRRHKWTFHARAPEDLAVFWIDRV